MMELDLEARGLDLVYLLDGNIVDIFERLESLTGVNLFAEIERQAGRTYAFTNDVVMELFNRPEGISTSVWMGHMMNAPGVASQNENRFIVEEDGVTKVGYGNMVSPQDWAQVVTCQDQEKLKLVTNDVNLGKNALRVIGQNRTKTVHSLVVELMEADPDNQALQKVFAIVNHPKMVIVKMEDGDPITWLKPPKSDH